jgi:hypothetical protein
MNDRQLDRGRKRLAAASSTRSAVVSCGRFACRCSTESSCRSTTISSSLNASERRRSNTPEAASGTTNTRTTRTRTNSSESAGRADDSTADTRTRRREPSDAPFRGWAFLGARIESVAEVAASVDNPDSVDFGPTAAANLESMRCRGGTNSEFLRSSFGLQSLSGVGLTTASRRSRSRSPERTVAMRASVSYDVLSAVIWLNPKRW